MHVPFTEKVCEAYLGPNAEFDTTLLRYHYQSLVTPMSVFEYDTRTGTSTLLKRTEVLGGYDPSLYASERVSGLPRAMGSRFRCRWCGGRTGPATGARST